MILNVNLAILNLLPIPVLDGGHIVLALIESMRRKPVNMRVLEIVQTGCAVLIIGYMVYISFFDVRRLARRLKAGEARASAKRDRESGAADRWFKRLALRIARKSYLPGDDLTSLRELLRRSSSATNAVSLAK